jgi:hypothetical protein
LICFVLFWFGLGWFGLGLGVRRFRLGRCWGAAGCRFGLLPVPVWEGAAAWIVGLSLRPRHVSLGVRSRGQTLATG